MSTNGASEYKLDKKVIIYSAHNAALISLNIPVKAKNFLVFQVDFEAVASQSPQELSRLIEQISGSLELAPEYEKAKEAQDKATKNAMFNFTKRRGIAGEIKHTRSKKAKQISLRVSVNNRYIKHYYLFDVIGINVFPGWVDSATYTGQALPHWGIYWE